MVIIIITQNFYFCRHSESKMCEYSGVDGCNNYCPYAHTKEELNEWHQRYLQKRARLKFIKESNALSPVDSLYHDYLKASRKSDIVSYYYYYCSYYFSGFQLSGFRIRTTIGFTIVSSM